MGGGVEEWLEWTVWIWGMKEALGGLLFLEEKETEGEGKASPAAKVYF